MWKCLKVCGVGVGGVFKPKIKITIHSVELRVDQQDIILNFLYEVFCLFELNKNRYFLHRTNKEGFASANIFQMLLDCPAGPAFKFKSSGNHQSFVDYLKLNFERKFQLLV